MPNWLTIRQAADEVGVTPRTIHRWNTKGYLTLHRLPSGRMRADRDEVAAFLAQSARRTRGLAVAKGKPRAASRRLSAAEATCDAVMITPTPLTLEELYTPFGAPCRRDSADAGRQRPPSRACPPETAAGFAGHRAGLWTVSMSRRWFAVEVACIHLESDDQPRGRGPRRPTHSASSGSSSTGATVSKSGSAFFERWSSTAPRTPSTSLFGGDAA
ncbi:MAG: MerR family DNA-binding transcriptional regulator [Dehalococcoidia bacterium]|nr:MerR family DNA-binding transcriptional regulator [Dehalococcoidia bacterium]